MRLTCSESNGDFRTLEIGKHTFLLTEVDFRRLISTLLTAEKADYYAIHE